ncbi:MAG: GrpB family protein, partial [Lachnospiraceae bacterium]|nr:GrpB family protein [Lachnospiraceae bacterium]
GKDLSKMTLEELWELFPIFLVPHDDQWKDSFNEIKEMLTGLLSDLTVWSGIKKVIDSINANAVA